MHVRNHVSRVKRGPEAPLEYMKLHKSIHILSGIFIWDFPGYTVHEGACTSAIGGEHLYTTSTWVASLQACRDRCSSTDDTDGMDCQALSYSDTNWCLRVARRYTSSSSVNTEESCSNWCDSRNAVVTYCTGYRWDAAREECIIEYQPAVGGDSSYENPHPHLSGYYGRCYIKGTNMFLIGF